MNRALRRQLRSWKQEFLAAWGRLRSFHRVSLGIILASVAMAAANRYVFASFKTQIREKRESLEKMKAPDVIMEPAKDPDLQELRLRIETLEESMVRHRQEKEKAIAAWPDFTTAQKGAILAKFDDLIPQSGLTKEEFYDSAIDMSPPKPNTSARAVRAATPVTSRRESSSSKTAKPEKEAAKAERPGDGKAKKESSKSAKTARTPPPKAPALNTTVHTYVVTGSFGAIRAFLGKAVAFEYPVRLESIRIQLGDRTADGTEAAPPQPNRAPELKLSFHLKLYHHE